MSERASERLSMLVALLLVVAAVAAALVLAVTSAGRAAASAAAAAARHASYVCASFFLSSYSGLLSRLLYLYAFLGGARTSTTAKTRTLCVRSVTRVRSMRGEVPNRHI